MKKYGVEVELLLKSVPPDGMIKWDFVYNSEYYSGFTDTRWGARREAKRTLRKILRGEYPGKPQRTTIKV